MAGKRESSKKGMNCNVIEEKSRAKKNPSQGMGKDYTQQFVTHSDEEESSLTNSRLKLAPVLTLGIADCRVIKNPLNR